MAAEFFRFLGGCLILLIPGFLLAGWLQLGRGILERAAYGGTLGFSLAVYLASLASQFDLRWFYWAWGAVALAAVVLGAIRKNGRRMGDDPDPAVIPWMMLLLALVGITRFAAALPQVLPRGWDPTFHMILARKIQLTQHAIHDWMPFEPIQLNYPTGSHVLIVVLSAMSGLPLHTVFKDLIPLLGVMSTLQVFVLVRRTVTPPMVALYAAIAYGLWANFGSTGYYVWGGLPNELSMLALLAVFSLWLEPGSPIARGAAMAACGAAVALVHHHTMVTGAILGVAIIIRLLIKPWPGSSWKLLVGAGVAAAAADLFFLIPYAQKAASLSNTHVFVGDEQPIALSGWPESFGYLLTVATLMGLSFLWLNRRTPPKLAGFPVIFPSPGTPGEGQGGGPSSASETPTPALPRSTRGGGKAESRGDWEVPNRRRKMMHPLISTCSLTLLVLFLFTEYLYDRAFTPSRFLTDLNYFLPIFAGVAAFEIQRMIRIGPAIIVIPMIAATAINWQQWKEMATPTPMPPAFLQACNWAGEHTSPDSIVLVDDEQADYSYWVPYLTWRRSYRTPIPVSEPIRLERPQFLRLDGLLSGKIPPDSPDMQIVEIVSPQAYTAHPELRQAPVIWSDPSGTKIVRLLPK